MRIRALAALVALALCLPAGATPVIRGSGVSGSAPTYAADATAGSQTSIDVVVPSGSENDLLLVFVGQKSDGGGTTPTSDGAFTDISSDPGASLEPSFLATRLTYSSSEPSTYAFTVGDSAIAISARITGQSVASPINGTPAYNEGNGTTLTCPSITTTVGNTLVLYVGVSRFSAFATSPSSATLQEEQLYPPADVVVAVAAKTQASAGATGTDTYTTSSTRRWICYTIAIAPA